MTEDIQSWEIFASLFRTGSVALSATEVGLDAPVVSKKISALEKKLGRKLFDLFIKSIRGDASKVKI